MNTWQVETSGNTMLVVRRHRGIQQDLARKPNGRIWWFESRDLAQTVDMASVRCAITTLRGATSVGMSADLCDDLADKLAQSIGDKT